ncbi:MAG: histidine phosphatase family protein [Anditalea sp.]
MRHGETNPGIGYNDDFNRKLSDKGINKLKRLNEVLQKKGAQFDLLIKSPALRTKQTAELISDNLKVKEQKIEEDIYESSLENLLEVINHLPDHFGNVLMVGHNPGINSLLAYLTNDFHISLLPGMMADVTFDLPEWKMLSKGSGCLNEVLQ